MGVSWRWLRRLLLLGLAVWALTVAAVLWLSDRALDRHADGRALPAPVDAAIVLGGGIDGDGVLSYSSRRRVQSAVRAMQAGRAERLIFSGQPPNPSATFSMGGAMRDYAAELGAPDERLLVEDRAASTFENLRFSFAMAEHMGLERLAIATDAYHLPRAHALARYFGRDQIGLIAAEGLEYDDDGARVWAITREALAWWYNLWKVALWEAMEALGLDEAARADVIR